MDARITGAVLLLTIGAFVSPAQAGTTDTAFTYQGQLKHAGVPVTGMTDVKFSLFDDAGALVGGPLIFNGQDRLPAAVAVENGLFSVELDFGADVFNGEPRHLAIEVRYPHDPKDTQRYVPLTPIQPITAVPYAMHVRGLTTNDAGGLQVSGDIQTGGTIAANAFGTNTPTVAGPNCDPNKLGVCNGNNFVECARLDGSCNFGIGTTNPLAKLHIGGTPGSDGIMFPDGTLQTTAATGGGGSGFWTASGDDIQNTNTGNVGIGAAAIANAKLHVNGGARFTGSRSVIIDGPFGSTSNSLSIYAITSGDTVNALNDGTGGGAGGKFSSRSGYGVEAYGGTDKAAVYGKQSGSGNAGEFVHQSSSQSGNGVYATTNSPNGAAVLGQSLSATSYGGKFFGGACTGFLPCGPALFAVGDTHMFGTVGINTTDTSASLYVFGTSDAEPDGGGLAIFGRITSGNVVIDGNEIMARNNGSTSTLFLNHDGGDVRISQAGTGKLIVPVIQITGADLAEKFPVSEEMKPGTVVEIDPDNAGKLRISRQEYNRRVAGVVSGAGGLSAGAILGNMPGFEDAPAIALSGRVWVNCDAAEHAIEPGDLLTTSNTPGHARKVTDYARAQGAIIGKAMSELAAGNQGLVLVLVSLQ